MSVSVRESVCVCESVCLSDPERGIAGRGTSELQDRPQSVEPVESVAGQTPARKELFRAAAASRYEGDGLRNLRQFRGM